jgi:hypothetical protein
MRFRKYKRTTISISPLQLAGISTMVCFTFHMVFAALVAAIIPALAAEFSVRPFKIDLNNSRLLSLARNTRLPTRPEYPGLGSTFGIDLETLRTLQQKWVTEYDWNAKQQKLNE